MTTITDLDILANPPDRYVWAGWPSRTFVLYRDGERLEATCSDEQTACSIHRALECAGARWQTEEES